MRTVAIKQQGSRGQADLERELNDVLPRYIRLPPQETLEKFSALSRGKLNQLILPTPEQPVPPVKSIRLPNKGKNKKGVRLILLTGGPRSLMGYLERLESEAP